MFDSLSRRGVNAVVLAQNLPELIDAAKEGARVCLWEIDGVVPAAAPQKTVNSRRSCTIGAKWIVIVPDYLSGTTDADRHCVVGAGHIQQLPRIAAVTNKAKY